MHTLGLFIVECMDTGVWPHLFLGGRRGGGGVQIRGSLLGSTWKNGILLL